MGYQFLPMVLRWRASRAEAPLQIHATTRLIANIVSNKRWLYHILFQEKWKVGISSWLKITVCQYGVSHPSEAKLPVITVNT